MPIVSQHDVAGLDVCISAVLAQLPNAFDCVYLASMNNADSVQVAKSQDEFSGIKSYRWQRKAAAGSDVAAQMAGSSQLQYKVKLRVVLQCPKSAMMLPSELRTLLTVLSVPNTDSCTTSA